MNTTLFFLHCRALGRIAFLAGVALLVGPARLRAQPGYQVSVSPGGPVALPANGTQTLTASASRPAFNIGGSGCGSGSVTHLTMLPDGKILAVGGFLRYNNDPATPRGLIRLTPDGLRDATFNAGGTGFGGGQGQTFVAAVQADGKILVGGNFTTYNGSYVSACLVRLNANGSLDTSFNAAGTGLAGAGTVGVRALAVQADGNIVVGGTFSTYNNDPGIPRNLLRLLPDGSLDPTFSGATLGFSPAYGSVYSLLLQPNDRIVVGGWFNDYNELGLRTPTLQLRNIVRLMPDGSVDYTFDASRTGFNDVVYALVRQPDGRLVVGGDFSTYNRAAVPRGLVRLTASGVLDATFNAGGSGLSNAGSNTFLAHSLAVQPDGKILAGGECTAYNGNAASPDHLLRLNTDGTLDTGFNTGGLGFDSFAWALALQADGRIVVGGNFVLHNGNAITPCLTRLNADGRLNALDEPVAGATYRWNTGATTPALTVTAAGTYSVTVTVGGHAVQSGAVTVTGGTLGSRATGPLAAGLSLYPNPARNLTALEIAPGPGAHRLDATLYDALGQPVRVFATAALPAAGLRLRLDVQGLAPGLYSLRLLADGHSLSHTLTLE